MAYAYAFPMPKTLPHRPALLFGEFLRTQVTRQAREPHQGGEPIPVMVGLSRGLSARARPTPRPSPPRPTGSPPRLARPHRVAAAATVRCSPYVALPAPCPAMARSSVTPALREAQRPGEGASEAGSGCLPRGARSLPRLPTGLTRRRRSASIPEPLTEPGQFGGGQGCDEAVEAIGFVINCTQPCTV